MGLKVWIDDTRPMPEEFDIWVQNHEDWMDISRKEIDFVSFDHDLGQSVDAYHIAKDIESEAYWGEIDPFSWEVHSANPVGAKRIRQALRNADRYWARMNHPLNDVQWLDEIYELELVNNEDFLNAMKKLATDLDKIELDQDVEEALLDYYEG